MKQQGFSLLECILYCVLSTLLIGMCMQWSITMLAAMRTSSASMNMRMTLCSALDACARDCATAPPVTQWKCNNFGEYIWSTGGHDTGWVFNKGDLLRCQGQYNSIANTWSKRSKSLAARNVQSFTIGSNKQLLTIVVATKGFKFTRLVVCNNRVLT